jgi:SAM-dependent methyltransferase
VSSITAIDVSQMMIDRYKAKTHELGAKHKTTMAIKGDMFSEPPEPLALAQDEYHNFSLITVGAALHHFPDTEYAVQCLARRTRPGGVLCVEDIFDNGHRNQGNKQPRGFTLDELRSVMSGAGLVDFRFEVLPDEFEIELPSEELVKMRWFIARAMKPVTN